MMLIYGKKLIVVGEQVSFTLFIFRLLILGLWVSSFSFGYFHGCGVISVSSSYGVGGEHVLHCILL